MGKWSRAEYDRTLLDKLEQLYQKCRDTSPHPIVDDRFRTFVRTLDVNDKAVQACFSNLIQHVHRKQLATSSSYTVDHPIFDSLTNADPPLPVLPRFDSLTWAEPTDNVDFWQFQEPVEDGRPTARSPTPMPPRTSVLLRAGSHGGVAIADHTEDDPPSDSGPSHRIAVHSLEPRPASASPPPLSASQAWLEEYYRTRQGEAADATTFYPYPSYTYANPSGYIPYSDRARPTRRRRQEDAEDESEPRRRRRRVDPAGDTVSLLGPRMERDRRRDGVVFPDFSPDRDINEVYGGVSYRASRASATPPRPL